MGINKEKNGSKVVIPKPASRKDAKLMGVKYKGGKK